MRQMFSKKQIEEIVKNVAKAGELDFSGVDLKAKTLEQSQANHAYNITIDVNDDNLTYTEIYNKCEVINGVLWIILTFKLKNETGASVSESYNHVSLKSSELTAIGNKIFVLSGEAISTTTTPANPIICAVPIYRGSVGNFETVTNSYLFRRGKNLVGFNLYVPTLANDAEMYFSARVPLTLI